MKIPFTFTCVRCKEPETYERNPGSRRHREYCRKCAYRAKLLDNSLRQADRYHAARALGANTYLAKELSTGSREKYEAGLAALRAEKERARAE